MRCPKAIIYRDDPVVENMRWKKKWIRWRAQTKWYGNKSKAKDEFFRKGFEVCWKSAYSEQGGRHDADVAFLRKFDIEARVCGIY